MVRGKFKLREIHNFDWGGGKYIFEPVYDKLNPEDVAYSKATPNGRIELTIDNPAAQEQFKLGEFYYFDASPVNVPQE